MGESKTLFCSSKFPWAREWITFKYIDNLARVLKRLRQPWSRIITSVDENRKTRKFCNNQHRKLIQKPS
jgi:hypothetical protein